MSVADRVDKELDLLKVTKVNTKKQPKSCPLCHKIFSKFAGENQQRRHIDACRKRKGIASLPTPQAQAPPPTDKTKSGKEFNFKRLSLTAEFERLARERAVPLDCLINGATSLGNPEEVNTYRSRILKDTRDLAAKVRQLASETRPLVESLGWARYFPRAAFNWGFQSYVAGDRMLLGRAWQQRCRQRQSDLLDLNTDPRCVVALSVIDLSTAFAELEFRYHKPRERLNTRRRENNKMKKKMMAVKTEG
ncbi:hypothetical protein FOL47_001971 [Perkinsus chesapeaki]|uniref:Uncharacterized protein n=1 Tax=Perkinsus chesapeaki TaxID=330153 RepID=A0A7J6N0K8_PERCH|nr:hypothetical protein FOL47_001971 [Perkinsus chesapeaki]